MRGIAVWSFLVLICFLTPPVSADDRDSSAMEEVLVIGQAQGFTQTQFSAQRSVQHADSAQLMNYVPGGAVISNGPLSGQIQYRGLFGPRLNVRIDGMLINGGGPNWMAPPLHHIPAGLLESLTVEQGIASISTGGGLGGAVTAQWKKPRFGESSNWGISGDIETSMRSVDEGSSLSALLGASSDQQRFYLIGSRDDGENYDFPAGAAASTAYERNASGVGYAARIGRHAMDFDFRRIETGETGTPSLPMDIEFFDSDLWNAQYQLALDKATVDIQLYGSKIDHRMNNYRMRPAPDFSSLMLPPFVGDDRSLVDTNSEEAGYHLSIKLPMASSEWLIGVDGHDAAHNATVLDPDFAAFFVNNFNNTQVDRSAFFTQWSLLRHRLWYIEAGLRLENVDQQSDAVDAFPARMVDMNPAMWGPCMPQCTPPRAVWMLRERFNSANRNISDDNVDWVLKTRYQITQQMILEFGIAQKTRSPIYQERFLWIPLEVNAGLGDGNNYVGNLELEPEVSRQLEFGLDWRSQKANFSPRLYYRNIDDYIQGMPSIDMLVIGVSTNANGDATPLVFSNVDASIRGVDIHFSYTINENWHIDGLAAWLEGKRKDINDHLYRIAPPNLRIGLAWEKEKLQLRYEQVFVARQNKLSATNTLDPANANNRYVATPGYGISHLYLTYTISQRFNFTSGIENLWDKQYTNHLSGFNRVQNSMVALGSRMPGQGRSLFARLRYQW